MAKTEDSPTGSGEDTLVLDAPYGYIDPNKQDMMFTDITSEILHSNPCTESIGRGDTYLSEGKSFPLEWPAIGVIYNGNNNRLMISLPCRRARRDRGYKVVNIFFLVDTGSPYSYLCHESMTALMGNPTCTTDVPHLIRVVVQDESFEMVFHLSPLGTKEAPGKFHDANVLGMDFLQLANVSMTVDTPHRYFRLFKRDRESMHQDYPNME